MKVSSKSFCFPLFILMERDRPRNLSCPLLMLLVGAGSSLYPYFYLTFDQLWCRAYGASSKVSLVLWYSCHRETSTNPPVASQGNYS